MQHSKLKVGHIYYVDFEPHRTCEFNGRHLALVLRKNNDNHTAIVLPLTSSSTGLGQGKIELGVLSCLPMNLQAQKTYAAVNSIRTVNCTRFYSVRDGGNNVEPQLDNANMKISFSSIIKDMMYNTDNSLKIEVLKDLFILSSVKAANDFAYDLLHKQKTMSNKKDITNIEIKIADIMIYTPYKLLYLQVDDAVKPLVRQVFLKYFFKILLTKQQ